MGKGNQKITTQVYLSPSTLKDAFPTEISDEDAFNLMESRVDDTRVTITSKYGYTFEHPPVINVLEYEVMTIGRSVILHGEYFLRKSDIRIQRILCFC